MPTLNIGSERKRQLNKFYFVLGDSDNILKLELLNSVSYKSTQEGRARTISTTTVKPNVD